MTGGWAGLGRQDPGPAGLAEEGSRARAPHSGSQWPPQALPAGPDSSRAVANSRKLKLGFVSPNWTWTKTALSQRHVTHGLGGTTRGAVLWGCCLAPGAPTRGAATGLTSTQNVCALRHPARAGFRGVDLHYLTIWGREPIFFGVNAAGLLPGTSEKAHVNVRPSLSNKQDCVSVDHGSSKGSHGPSQAPGATLAGRPSAPVPTPPLAVNGWGVLPLGAPRWLGQGAMQGLAASQTGRQGSLGCGLLRVLQLPSGIHVGVSPRG